MFAKVSVIIPTYNRESYLKCAIDSVLRQSCQDFEIIVVDDGSTDNTRELVSKYIEDFPEKISYFYQENRGPAAARNKGIREAHSEYIGFLDSDDEWLPEKLEKSLRFLKVNNFDWVATASYKIGLDHKDMELRLIDGRFLDSLNSKRLNLLKNGLFFFSSLPLYLPSVLLKAICFKQTGLFDESFKVGEDTDLWLRLEESKFAGGYLDEPLFRYRTTDSSITRSNATLGLKEHLRLADKHAKILGIKSQTVRRTYSSFLWRCADLFFSKREYLPGFGCLIKSVFLYPELTKLRKILFFARPKPGYKRN